MNMLKRSLAMVMVLCMLFSAVPVNAFATESSQLPGESLTETADNPTGGNSTADAAVISDEDTASDDDEGEETPAEGEGEETPAEGEGEETPAEGEGEETPAEGEGEVTPAEGEGEETPAEGEGEETPAEGEGEGEQTPADDEYGIVRINKIKKYAKYARVVTAEKPADGTTNGQPFPTALLNGGHYRIPALVTMPNGTLVAAADARWHAWDNTDDNGDIDTIVSRSTDGGTTWNYTFANYINNGNTTNYGAATFIDPALVEKNGTLYMMVDLFPGQASQTNCSGQAAKGTGYNSSGDMLLSTSNPANANSTYNYFLHGGQILDEKGVNQGYSVDEWFNVTKDGVDYGNLFSYDNTSGFHPMMTSHLYLTTSTDNGKTWSAPKMINHQVKNAASTYFVVSPGRGIVTSDGTIIFGAYDATNGEEQTVLIYSKDNGTTWSRTASAGFRSSENEIVELSDGTLRMFYRYGYTSPKKVRYVDITKDATGNYSWGNPVSTTADFNGNVNISAISYSKTYGGKQVIFVSCPADTSGQWNRYNGKIYTFTVDNDTKAMELVGTYDVNSSTTTDAFSYSCLTELADGSIGMLYEKGDSGNITYVKVSAETVSGLTFDSITEEEPDASGVTIIHDSTGIAITAPGLEKVDITPDEAVVEGTVVSKTYSVTLNDGAYTGKATVKIPYDTAFDGCNAFTGYVGTDTFSVTREGNYFLCKVPHFSEIRIVGSVNIANTVAVRIPVGGTYTDHLNASVASGSNNSAAANVSWVDETVTRTTHWAQLGNDSSFAGDRIDLASCLYTFTKNATGETWELSAYANGVRVYVNPYNKAGFPNRESASNVTITESGYTRTTDGAFILAGSNADGKTGSLHFHTNTSGNNGLRWNQCSNPHSENYSNGTHGIYIFVLNADGTLTEVTTLAGLVSGSQYLIAGKGWDGKYYVMHPTANDSPGSEYEQVAKVTDSIEQITTGETTVTIQGLTIGTAAVVVGTTQYNITVYGEKTISVNYQVNGTTVKTVQMKVASDAVSETLPVSVTGSGGKTYRVMNTQLTLTDSTTVYNVEVEELKIEIITSKEDSPFKGNTGSEGQNKQVTALIISTNTSYDLDVEGNNVVWGTTGSEITVNQNGTVTGVSPTAGENPVYVTAKVGEKTYAIPVTVLQADNDSGNVRTLDFYSQEVTNCTAYYSYQGADLVEFPEGAVFYVTNDMVNTDIMTFFATPDPGYALTYTNGTGGRFFHPVRNASGNAPGYDGNDHNDNLAYGENISYIYLHDQLISRVVNNSKALDTDGVHSMLEDAVDKGCDGAFFFSRATNKGNVSSTTTCIAEKLATIDKSIEGVLPKEELLAGYKSYVEGMEAHEGDYVYFKITVTQERPLFWQENSTTQAALVYGDVKLTDTALPGAYFYDKALDRLDVGITVPEHEYQGLDGLITNPMNQHQELDITEALNAAWRPDETKRDLSYYVVYKIKNTDSKLYNTADLSYSYSSSYSSASKDLEADAQAEIRVAGAKIPDYVIDFGLPMVIDGITETQLPAAITGETNTKYGKVLVQKQTDGTYTITYTPTQVMKGVETIELYGTYNVNENGSVVEKRRLINDFKIYPATTVYYEESFLTYDNKWSTPTAPTKLQATEILGDTSATASRARYNYGFDPAYVSDGTGSNGTKVSTETNGATASFTFTGTGFALYANCHDTTGYVTLTRQGSTKKMYMMDTGLNYQKLEVNMPGLSDNEETEDVDESKPTGTFYNIPVITERNLPYGEYTVTIRKTHNDGKYLEIDGFRIYETIDESEKDSDESVYYADKEDKPVFYELRDLVLKAIGVTGANSSQVYKDLGDLTGIITSAGVPYANKDDEDSVNNLLVHGPKNEIYLYKDQTLTFKVETDRAMQIGLKAPNGTTTYNLTCDNGGSTISNATMKSSVDMFYNVGNPTGAKKEFTVSVTNTGEKTLSVTELKVCDDPGFSFAALTEEDIAAILDEPTEPEAPTFTLVELKGADVLIDGTVFDYTGEPIEPAITVNVGGTQLVAGRDYSVTYTNNVEPGTATVTVRGIATASETLGYTGEISIDYTINAPVTPEEPEVPVETTKPTEPSEPSEPAKPGKPGKPSEPAKPSARPAKPNKPGKNKVEAELKISLVDYTGKVLGTAKLTAKGNNGDTCYFKAKDVLKAATTKLPGKYEIVDGKSVSGVEVVFGAEQTVEIQVGKVATLKVTYINLLGKKMGTATISKVQTSNVLCVFSAAEIQKAAPKGCNAIGMTPTVVSYGKNASVVVTVF